MTQALCLNCGNIKFGALLPCAACKSPPYGDDNVDIMLTDHYNSIELLEHFGSVIKEIQSRSDDANLCFWTFMHYVSNHPEGMLNVELNPHMLTEAKELLLHCALPALRE